MRLKLKVIVVGGAVILCAGAGPVHAQAFLDIVTPDRLVGPAWTGKVSGRASLRFVADPSQGGVGVGSLRFRADGDDSAQLRLSDATWQMKLSDLLGLSYRALAAGEQCKRHNKRWDWWFDRDGVRGVVLLLDLDTDGDLVADEVLVFDPALNGGVLCNDWQDVNARQGLWYSADDRKGPRRAAPLADHIADHPSATIVYGGIRAVVGNGFSWDEATVYLDSLNVSRAAICGPTTCVSGPSGTYFFRQTATP